MNNIFVTGINGFLGTNLCHDLLARGYKVKGLVRNLKKYKGIRHPNLELIEGTLFDNLIDHLESIDCIIHTAAMTQQNTSKYAPYWRVNYNATIQLFHAAIKKNVKRFIFVSTANTIGYGGFSKPGHEEAAMRIPFTQIPYAKSKSEAEDYLLSHQQKMDVMIVNPTFMLGAFDTKPSSGKIILMCWKKKIVFIPPGGKNFVHVEDVSKGIIQCIHLGKHGQRYLLANENLSYKHFFLRVNALSFQAPLMINAPKNFFALLGFIGDLLRKFNIRTNLSTNNMHALCIDNFFSNQKSIRELHMEYKSIDLAILDAISYFSTSFKKTTS